MTDQELSKELKRFDPIYNSVWVDMDGVVADFDAFVWLHMGRTFSHKEGPGSDKEMWDFLSRIENLYFKLPYTPYAAELLDAVLSVPALSHKMLTAIPRRASVPTAEKDKINWMSKHFSHLNIPVHIGPYSRDKWKHCKPGDILIDDREDNIEEWRAAGGIGILHYTNDGERTIQILRELTA